MEIWGWGGGYIPLSLFWSLMRDSEEKSGGKKEEEVFSGSRIFLEMSIDIS